jgi:hypothetical protein
VPLASVEVSLDEPDEYCLQVEQRVSDLEGLVVPAWQQVLAGRYASWQCQRDGARLEVDGAQDSAVTDFPAHVASVRSGRQTRRREAVGERR